MPGTITGRDGIRTNPLDLQLSALHDSFIAERPAGADEDVHMLASIVDHVIERCTAVGDSVFDPFAGFGTTLTRAEALGRTASGIELLPERVEFLQNLVPAAHVIEGDARELLRLTKHLNQVRSGAGFDLVLSSPPYMTEDHHEADPLTAYEMNNGNYERYLRELGLVAAQCAMVVAPSGFVVWNVANIHHGGTITRLIEDCTRALSQHLRLVGITEIVWDRYPHDLVADALLVFQRPATVEHDQAGSAIRSSPISPHESPSTLRETIFGVETSAGRIDSRPALK